MGALLEADPRIEAAFVVGSMAEGKADAYSDVDLVVAVRAGSLDAVFAERRRYYAGSPLCESVHEWGGGRKAYVLMPCFVILELAFFAPAIRFRMRGPYRMLFDRAGVVEQLPKGPRPTRRVIPIEALAADDVPFALLAVLKTWARGDRRGARRLLRWIDGQPLTGRR